MPNSSVTVGRTRAGFRIRVEGAGTMRNSPTVHAFVTQTLNNHQASALVVDLARCEYLDSTFLGCLVDLHKRYGMRQPSRLTVAAPPEAAHRLLGPTHLDRFLHISDVPPETIGNEVELPQEDLGPDDLGRHLLDCHRRLAEVEGPNQAIFQRIADRLATELEAKQAAPGG